MCESTIDKSKKLPSELRHGTMGFCRGDHSLKITRDERILSIKAINLDQGFLYKSLMFLGGIKKTSSNS